MVENKETTKVGHLMRIDTAIAISTIPTMLISTLPARFGGQFDASAILEGVTFLTAVTAVLVTKHRSYNYERSKNNYLRGLDSY